MHWGFEDPSALEGSFDEQLIKVKQIRNQIRSRINNWVEEQIIK
jgi:arsenate reductase